MGGNASRVWIEYDPRNDVLYAMRMSSDLYRLERAR